MGNGNSLETFSTQIYQHSNSIRERTKIVPYYLSTYERRGVPGAVKAPGAPLFYHLPSYLFINLLLIKSLVASFSIGYNNMLSNRNCQVTWLLR
jgi:hypothetical protein